MEIPAPVAGVVDKLLVKLGDKVSEGTPIATIAASNGAPAGEEPLDAGPATAEPPEVAPVGDAPPPSVPQTKGLSDPASGGTPAPPAPALSASEAEPAYASPLALRLARELGVELRGIQGSGRNGRITRDDVVEAA